MGNHDVMTDESRLNALDYCSDLFPGEGFNYVLQQKNEGKPHLNIVSLDWHPSQQPDFLKKALDENGDIPVFLMTHCCLMALSKRTDDGYQLKPGPPSREIVKILKESEAPTITAISGHYHYNSFDHSQLLSLLSLQQMKLHHTH